MQATPNIFIHNATLAYKDIVLFNNFNVTIKAGQCTCLLGPSGVGKSTLLHMIANILPSNNTFKGKISCDNGLPLSSQISYMAQTDLLMPWLSALDNALLQSRLEGTLTSTKINQATTLFQQMQLTEAIHKYPDELSGGMKQRVALIRTFMQDKPIILMDEPFSALDAMTRYQLQTLAAQLFKNRTVLLVTHDPMEALRLADEIIILSGRPAELNRPLSLHSPTPREPTAPDVLKYQAELFHALMKASEFNV